MGWRLGVWGSGMLEGVCGCRDCVMDGWGRELFVWWEELPRPRACALFFVWSRYGRKQGIIHALACEIGLLTSWVVYA